LGHPIANDALYVNPNPPSRTEAGTSAERAARLIIEDDVVASTTENMSSNIKRRKIDIDKLQQCNDNLEGDIKSDLDGNGDVDFAQDPFCTHCPKLAPSGYNLSLGCPHLQLYS
jgi:hypothetical protein